MGAQGWNFRYEARRIIVDRQAKRARDEAAKPYVDKGFRVLDHDPEDANSDGAYIHLDRLVTADGDPVTPEYVEAQPASWHVWLTVSEGTRIFTKTDERISEQQVDWATEGDSDAKPAAGLHHFDQVEVGDEWLPDFYITDPAAVGLNHAAPTGTVSDPRAERAQAEADAKEAERNMRRTVIRLNKLGQAAIDARRQWLTTYMHRTTPPASAAQYVAEAILHDPHLLTQHNGTTVVADLLGIDQAKLSFGEVGDYVTGLSAARAQVLTLAFVLACQEARIYKDAWRYPERPAARYLQFLQSLGHQLSPIEEVVTGDRTVDTVSDGL